MKTRLGLLSVVILLLAALNSAKAQQPAQDSVFPMTTDGIHVFNDQIDVQNLTDVQIAFAATHYDGAQKLTRDSAERLRALNPNFVVLHYRLGLGIGYRRADDDCAPTGDYLAHIRGNDWVEDWPDDDVVQEDWLYHYQGERVFWCTWGWYLANTDNPDWRAWWIATVRDELNTNATDGLFSDSVSVPNYLGASEWNPALPDYDPAFESEWTRRIDDWLAWANQALGDAVFVVNTGAWVTSRDTVDYSLADGVMVEGFAGWGEYDRFEIGDWELQMDRVLSLVSRNRAVILQSYVADPHERLWTIANYLLVQGQHTYINLETSQNVEWFPEYDLPIGTPLGAVPTTALDLRTASGLYERHYTGGRILVNPDPDGPAIPVHLDQPLYLVTGTIGGGDLPADADISGWNMQTIQVTDLVVAPGDAAILLNEDVPTNPVEVPGGATGSVAPLLPDTADASAFHRSGQTFLTWPEVPNSPALTYRIYRHTSPINSATVTQAQLLAEVPQGSGIYWTERARAVEPPIEDAGYMSLRNYVISDLGSQLPDGTGLFVWTTHADGPAYYALTTGNGDLLKTIGPIEERVAESQPVLVQQSADGRSRVYTQFMDYATYNPTFDAPREGNNWMNLPNWEQLAEVNNLQQYAYNYWVGLPSNELCEGPVPDTLPLVLHIEGWGSRYATPADSLYWCVVHLWADDPNQSWYYGFSATHDYRTSAPVTTGPLVNYTEERLLRAVHEMLTNPALPPIDKNRVYVYGHSMGGTGALMLAERYPNIFAAAAASEPMMDFESAVMWIEELTAKWGDPGLNLPVESRGRDATGLARYNGTGVWDWQNLGDQLAARRGDDMAFIAIAHGTQDTVIDWRTVAQPSYPKFYAGSRAFIGEILSADHTWLGFREHPNWSFDRMDFVRNESFPALSYATGSLPAPPDGVGGYNISLEWSSTNNNFAGPPVDQMDRWEIALRSMQAVDQTVTLTPRRLQVFTVAPGIAYAWQNVRLDTGQIVQSGTVEADADGLLVIPDVIVSAAGNRVIVQPG